MGTYTKFRGFLAGIVSGAMLVAVPSFMILRGMQILSVQEAVLWTVQFIGCVIAGVYFSDRRKQIPIALFGYVFLLLFNALSILCGKLNYGIIAWEGMRNGSLAMVGGAIIAFSLLAPRMSKEQARVIYLLCIALALAGVSFVYCTWLPLFAIPGALVLAAISGAGESA